MKSFTAIFMLICHSTTLNGIFVEGRKTSSTIDLNVAKLIANVETKEIRKETRYLQVNTPSQVPTIPECYICGASDMKPMNFSGTLTVYGFNFDCAGMDLNGKANQIYPNDCPVYQEAAKENCACDIGTADDNPMGSEPCYICGASNMKPEGLDGELTVDGENWNCAVINLYGTTNLIGPSRCPTYQEAAKETCDCVADEEQRSPTARGTPTVPSSPSSSAPVMIIDWLTLIGKSFLITMYFLI